MWWSDPQNAPQSNAPSRPRALHKRVSAAVLVPAPMSLISTSPMPESLILRRSPTGRASKDEAQSTPFRPAFMGMGGGAAQRRMRALLSCLKPALLALTFISPLALAACSGFTPVYSEGQPAARAMTFAYAEPRNRLEQVIYQELGLRLGKTTDASAPLIQVTTSVGSRDLTLASNPNPSDPREAVVTATATVLDGPGGRQLVRITRNARASYTENAQGLANFSARTEAEERAAKSAAESLRLALLGALSR
jgi:LPS-assembly lipoprotein